MPVPPGIDIPLLIREFLGVTAYGPAAREVVVETCLQAARTRDDLPDLINMAIEELIRQRFELPAFSTLLRIARTTRSTVNRRYQLRVCELLDADARQRLLAILSRSAGESRSLWDQVKREPKRSTVPAIQGFPGSPTLAATTEPCSKCFRGDSGS